MSGSYLDIAGCRVRTNLEMVFCKKITRQRHNNIALLRVGDFSYADKLPANVVLCSAKLQRVKKLRGWSLRLCSQQVLLTRHWLLVGHLYACSMDQTHLHLR